MEPLKQTYLFDILVTKSSLQRGDDEDCPHKYSVRLFDSFVEVTADRLFVERFPSSPLGEFLASPCELVGSLTTKGICVIVDENNEMLACGNCTLSSSFLSRLADPTFTANEVVHVQLEKNKQRVGELDLNIKITCAHPDLETRLLPFGCYDVCRPRDKSINPRDVIFTLGRSSRCPATSCITDERLMSHAGAPFSCLHKKIEPLGRECGCAVKGVKPPPELDMTKERERKLLKKLFEDLEIEKEHVPTPPSGHEHSRQCRYKSLSTSSTSDSYHSINEFWMDAEDNQEEQQINNFDADLTPQQIEELELVRKQALGFCTEINTPKLMGKKYSPPLLCPVCHANITWLPKISACPYCGYKRYDMEPPSEQPFDETATAAELVHNHYLDSQRKQSSTSARHYLGSKKCTCKKGRICTRCRIQELCDQMFNKNPTPKPTSETQEVKKEAKREIKLAEKQVKLDTKSPKKTPSTESQRGKELLKIFNEMHDLYSGKKSEKELTDRLLKNCEADCRKPSKIKKNRRRSCQLKKALRDLEKASIIKKPKAKSLKAKNKRRFKSKRYTFLVHEGKTRSTVTHHTCKRGLERVPCHMGWLWTKSEQGRISSWKPGAIKKSIRVLMSYFLKDYPLDRIAKSRFHCSKRKGDQEVQECKEEPLIQHPTLHIVKKHDEYVITLRPLKDPKTLAMAANPYANMKPIVFRISKDPVATNKRNIKISLKEQGYPVCSCKQPVSSCFCRSYIDQKMVADQVKMLSAQLGWADISDTFVYSDLSESDSENELEFGVTPPAGIVKPERLRKPDLVHCETQYNENDWALPTMYPHPPNALMQYGGCVIGERKKRFDWIMGKGFVHRQPKPAKKINKPKKGKKTNHRLKGGFDGAHQNDNSQCSDIVQPNVQRVWHKSNDL